MQQPVRLGQLATPFVNPRPNRSRTVEGFISTTAPTAWLTSRLTEGEAAGHEIATLVGHSTKGKQDKRGKRTNDGLSFLEYLLFCTDLLDRKRIFIFF